MPKTESEIWFKVATEMHEEWRRSLNDRTGAVYMGLSRFAAAIGREYYEREQENANGGE